jgi:hypothetical protein
MAKNRDERYHSTEDLLEDLQAVRRGEPPQHARRNVDLDALAKVEESGQTVDIAEPEEAPAIWNHPMVIGLLAWVGVSVIIIMVLIVMLLTRSSPASS